MQSPSAILSGLRKEIAKRSLHALVVPTSDPHNSEYVADVFKRRDKISGFRGSAGTAVVTENQALLWTDGRYWLEAEKTLWEGWRLMKDNRADPNNLTVEKFINSLGHSRPRVGVDPFTVTQSWWDAVSKEGISVEPTDVNLVDLVISGVSEQQLPDAPIVPHDIQYAGVEAAAKMEKVVAALKGAECDFTLLSALDDIAWLFNLRGSDVECNPVFYAYAVVHATGDVVLFTEPKKLTDAARESLPKCCTVQPYTALKSYLSRLSGKTCAAENAQLSAALRQALEAFKINAKKVKPIVQFLKAIKSERELRGFRECHVRDGAKLTRFLAWIDRRIRDGHTETEVSAAQHLLNLRKEDPLFVQPSFETIAGTGPNGAIIHYRPDEDKPVPLSASQLFLCDSGGQYQDGTTDVTRTLCFGTPTDEERLCYTLVLKGHIALNTAVFPPATTGHRLDSFARMHLWKHGLDYAHGTGHGVGYFLNVHEGPQGIGSRPLPLENTATIDRDMIVSNEPGFYKAGGFGIRIENLDAVVAAKTQFNASYNTFESLTMAPLCRDLIDVKLLTPEEVSWVNRYHEKVMSVIAPLIEGDADASEYLKKHAAPI